MRRRMSQPISRQMRYSSSIIRCILAEAIPISKRKAKMLRYVRSWMITKRSWGVRLTKVHSDVGRETCDSRVENREA